MYMTGRVKRGGRGQRMTKQKERSSKHDLRGFINKCKQQNTTPGQMFGTNAGNSARIATFHTDGGTKTLALENIQRVNGLFLRKRK